jgi:hypothetical protein
MCSLRASRCHNAGAGSAVDRLANPFIGTAPAQVAVHGLGDLLIGRIRRLRQKSSRGHYLPCLAIAALRNLFLNPRLLQDMQAIRTQPFYRRDRFPHDLRHRRGAGSHGCALNMHGTSAAKPRATARFRSRKVKRIPQNPEQGSLRRNAYFLLTTVYAQCDFSHIFRVDFRLEHHPTQPEKKVKWARPKSNLLQSFGASMPMGNIDLFSLP